MNDYHPFLNFKEVINSSQEPVTKSYRPKTRNGDNSNNGCCIQCNRPRVNTNHYPFCGAICMGAWNAARAEDVKDEKNMMGKFSEVISDIEGRK